MGTGHAARGHPMNDDERNAEYLELGPNGAAAVDTDTAAELDALRDQLAAPATWAEPPADLRDAVVAAVASARVEDAPPARQSRAARSSRRRWLAVAAAAAIVVAGAGAFLATRDTGSAGETVAVAGTDLAPGARGEATLDETGSGLSIRLRITDLPPAPAGAFYQAWMKGDRG